MLFRILIPLLFLLLVPVCSIDERWLSRYVHGWRRSLIYVPNVVLSLSAVIMGINESYTVEAAAWKSLLITLILIIVVPETVLALCLQLAALAKTLCRRKKSVGTAAERLLRYLGLGVSTVLFVCLVLGTTVGYRCLTVKHYDYHHRDIPAAFDGYRIVQLSDLHLGTLRHHRSVVEHIVDSVNACHPDLVVFTGDLVNYQSEELDSFVNILNRLEARDGVVSVMGNHDYAQYYHWASPADSLGDIRRLQEMERAMGWHLLLNEHHLIRRDTDSLAIVGVENDGRPPFPARGNLPAAQCGLSDSCFQILLSHDPTHWRRRVLRETKIPLMLAGHTHGMQLKLGNFSPAAWFYKEWGGAYTSDGRTLYVSLGTGEVLIPFRFGAWPEITLITLHTTD